MKSFQVADFNAPLQEVDQPTPRPSGTQVLLKVKAAGVCHSDLHIWEGGYDLGHGRKPLSLKDRGVSLPRTMGHESVGEVLAFGPDATDTAGLKVGDVVLVYPWLGCGKCETCLGGDENMCAVKPNAIGVYCDGGYADHMTVPHPKYLIDLKGLDPVTAAPYACSGVTTYSALKKVEKDFNTPIVIFGAGGLGLMALSLLKAMGGKGAIVVDIDARKRDAAMAAGALATVDGKAPDALEQLTKAAGGPIRAVIDLVGNAATAQLGFDCLSKGGKLVIVGLFGGGAPWALPLIPIKAATIQGSYVGNLQELRELMELVATGAVARIRLGGGSPPDAEWQVSLCLGAHQQHDRRLPRRRRNWQAHLHREHADREAAARFRHRPVGSLRRRLRRAIRHDRHLCDRRRERRAQADRALPDRQGLELGRDRRLRLSRRHRLWREALAAEPVIGSAIDVVAGWMCRGC